jgi:hypothetical protein
MDGTTIEWYAGSPGVTGGVVKAFAPEAGRQGTRFSRRGMELLVQMQSRAALVHTARRFPHVVDRLADAWGHVVFFEAVIEELTRADRPADERLPPTVDAEVSCLRDLHAQTRIREAVSEALNAEGRRGYLAYPPGSVE